MPSPWYSYSKCETYVSNYIFFTGKTSLCKALAQKLSIRLSKLFTTFQLIEINSHSLFSKWFSEVFPMITVKIFEILKDNERER